MEVKFTVYGEPVAKGRPRMTRSGHTYTPQKTVNYENLVKLSYQEQVRQKLDGYISATINAYFAIPKSASQKKQKAMISGEILPTKKPDTDNIAKAILDSLNNIAYNDDSQVTELVVRKYYGEQPRVEVALKGVEGGNP